MLFVAGRGLLRKILGSYLGIPAEGLHFSVGTHGKPFLSAITDTNRQLHFNLSHSGGIFLLAIATDCAVGIDVEQLRMETPILDMARLAFSPCEQKELQGLPHHLQRSAFFRGWTRKEAYLKACGMGFDLPSNSFDVSLSPETPASMVAPNDLSLWLLHDIRVPVGYCAALAVQGSTPLIRYID
jgi:4'-phosphopantetheinyl transferase